MAEETQTFQNKKLLIVSIVLAVVVVIIYNVHIQAIQNKLAGQKTELLRYVHDMSAGDKIRDKDIEVVKVPQEVSGALGNFLKADNVKVATQDGGKELLVPVKKNDFVLYNQFESTYQESPVPPGMVAISIDLLPNGSIGTILRLGDKVNLVGIFPVGAGQQAQACRIISGVRVIAIAGKGTGVGKASAAETGMSGYRQITIAVPGRLGKEDIALQLRNVLTHAIGGGVMLELSNDSSDGVVKIDPKLDPYKNQAAVTSRG